MTNLHSGEWAGFGILAFLGVWWLGWLFTRGMAASRKDHALKTGDASGLTLNDKEENRAAFIADMSKPGAAVPGSSMHTAKACATLGVTLVAVGMGIGMFTDGGRSIASFAICAGLLLAMLGGAVAIGGGK